MKKRQFYVSDMETSKPTRCAPTAKYLQDHVNDGVQFVKYKKIGGFLAQNKISNFNRVFTFN